MIAFANGRPSGVWGRGKEATRDPLPVDLRAGDYEFVFLFDNMGRVSEGAQADYKGIFDPAFIDADVRPPPAAEWSRPASPPSNTWPFQTYRFYAGGFNFSTHRLDGHWAGPSVRLQAFINDRPLGRYQHIGPQQGLYVPDRWIRDENRVAIFDEGGRLQADFYLLRDARVPTQPLRL